MKKALLASVMAVVLLAALPAFANAKATQKTCDSLNVQLAQAMETHGKAVKINQAEAMYVKGEKACKAGNFVEGTKAYEAGLRDLGVTPVL